MLIKQFKDIEKLFAKLVKGIVYGDNLFVVLESADIDLEDNFVKLKFRYGIDSCCQNNPSFCIELKDLSNLDYLRGRFTQYLDERHIENEIWERKLEEK